MDQTKTVPIKCVVYKLVHADRRQFSLSGLVAFLKVCVKPLIWLFWNARELIFPKVLISKKVEKVFYVDWEGNIIKKSGHTLEGLLLIEHKIEDESHSVADRLYDLKINFSNAEA